MCFAAGSEFLLPVRGFFCLLCKEFYGDAICAEEHVTTHSHNDKYKVFYTFKHAADRILCMFLLLRLNATSEFLKIKYTLFSEFAVRKCFGIRMFLFFKSGEQVTTQMSNSFQLCRNKFMRTHCTNRGGT